MNVKVKLTQIWAMCAVTIGVLLVAGLFAPINDVQSGSVYRFVGRFHVLVLHFPVVLILLAPILDLLARRERFCVIRPLLPGFWVFAAGSAVITALLGLTLAASEGYSAETVADHRFEGVAVAIAATFVAAVRFSLLLLRVPWMRLPFAGLAAGLVALTFVAAHAGGNLVRGEDYLVAHAPGFVQTLTGYEDPADTLAWAADEHPEFSDAVQPLLTKYCHDCHGADLQRGNMRIDVLNPDMTVGDDAPVWHEVLNALNAGEMPPNEKPQPSLAERDILVAWLTEGLEAAAEAKKDDANPVLRRLTKQQYTNTLKDLLGIDVDFGAPLPDDGKSAMGFDNSASVLQTSPLHLDNYQAIAHAALDKALSIGPRPETKCVKVTLGKDISDTRSGGYVAGFQSRPLKRQHFLVDFLNHKGEPIQAGTTEDREQLAASKSLISIGQRGSSYNRYRIAPDGMLLNSALPHIEVAPESWHGPSPNLALQLKQDFPREGNFEFRVRASKGYVIDTRRELFVRYGGARVASKIVDGELQIAENAIILTPDNAENVVGMKRQGNVLVPEDSAANDHSLVFNVDFADSGIYQLDIVYPTPSEDADIAVFAAIGSDLTLEPRNRALRNTSINNGLSTSIIGASYLNAGKQQITLGGQFFVGIEKLIITPLNPEDLDSELRSRLELNQERIDQSLALGKRTPSIRTFVGTRTDDGLDYAEFGTPLVVKAPLGDSEEYVFKGRLENLPLPAEGTSSADADRFAGIMMIGLWNDHLVKAADDPGPPLLIESVEFAGPLYDDWPSASHRAIFFDSENEGNEALYTQEVLERFMSRAFRRPAKVDEVERYMRFWHAVRPEYEVYEASVKEVLAAVLSSPLFLFMPVEEPNLPDSGAEFALASRLSYFLWNSPPDAELISATEQAGSLQKILSDETERMVQDDRFWRFIKPFSAQWLRLDRHSGAIIDPGTYPDYTRFVKRDLQQETYHFLHHVFAKDLPITTLIESDFAMLNQNLAEYYGIEGVSGQHFRPVSVNASQNRGGLLSQGAFLSGHSDGIDGHPIKRAVWVMEKILGDEPPPPPPNVPDLDPETPGFEKLTLKEQLEQHRDKDSCRSCHEKIDPYGLVFENFDASGRWRDEAKGRPVDASSILPDGTELNGVSELKTHILHDRRDDFVRSVIKHLYAYALGRDIHFSDEATIETMLAQVKQQNYRAQSVIEAIVTSDGFLNQKEPQNEKTLAIR